MCIHDLQYTSVDNVNLGLTMVNCGVPQGSVLGPLLFLIYMNDIVNTVPGNNVKLFADDTNLCVSGTNSCLLNQTANEYIQLLNDWLLTNRLSLNLDKTCYMIFAAKKIITLRLC